MRPGPEEPSAGCHLCGLPLGPSPLDRPIAGQRVSFCCHGCHQVFLLLSAATGVLPEHFRETDLYRLCLEWRIVRGPAGTTDPPPPPPDLPFLELTCKAEGMWCPSCAWLMEEVLRRTEGVIEPRVSFASDTVHLKYLPQRVSPREIASRIERLGYRLSLGEEGETARAEGGLLFRLGLSAILTAQIMMGSLLLYSGFSRALSKAVIGCFSYPLFGMATAVLFYGGLPILKRGFAALRYRSPSMDTLVSLGALSSYLYSGVQVARGSLHLYFDTASMLITLVLLGRYLELRARERVSAGIAGLYRAAGGKVRISEGDREKWVSPGEMQPGDAFTVVAGETIPLDGRIMGGRALVDESLLTGEARPRAKTQGDTVVGGSTVRDGELSIEATCTARESLVGRIIAAVEDALARKSTHEIFADRVCRFFVPLVLTTAGVVAVCARICRVPADQALLRSLAVLLISCPCALGIAIPLVKVAVIGLARKQGILVRESAALERLKELDTIVFDKTGTLTEGRFALETVVGEGLDVPALLSRLASVEIGSDHFLAHEIVREARRNGGEIGGARGLETFHGLGIRGWVGEEEISIGNRRFMEESGIELPEAFERDAGLWERKGRTTCFFAWHASVRGFLVFGDPVRPGAREVVRRLHRKRIEVWLISGDGRTTTEAVARSLGIRHCRGQVLPTEKVEFIERLQAEGHGVAMVGDGLNDAGALARADVGCGVGPNTSAVRDAADLTFLSPDPGTFFDALKLSVLTTRTIRQNLFLAFFYNAVAIPAAAAGLLSPLIAVSAMFLSSLMVTGNALRISSRGLPTRLDPAA